MSKKNLGVIFQAITGHGLFGHHISKWKMTLIKHASAVWKKRWKQLGTYGVNALH